MKIYFMRNESGSVCGAQIVTSNGKKYDLLTNSKLDGLWKNGQQVEGTCDFDLRCSAATARKRIVSAITAHLWRSIDDCEAYEFSRKRLFEEV